MKLIIKKIIPTILLFLITSPIATATSGWEAGIDLANNSTNLPSTGPMFLLISLFLWLLKIFIIMSVIAFVIAGIIFLFSGVNNNLRERAKDIVTYSIIGITVGFAGIIILSTILALLFGGGIVGYIL